MEFTVYNISTGEILRSGYAPNEWINLQTSSELEAVHLGEALDASMFFFVDGQPIQKPNAPSNFHSWDWSTKSWLPNLDAARESKLQQVAVELNARLYLPCNGFDADNVARGRISGTLARLQRGDGLPAGWIGWRDASNQQHWAEDDAATVLASLAALSCAIEDREQALLAASWQHKANLNALEDFAAILSYDTTTGWPS